MTTPPEQLDHLLGGLDPDELATPFHSQARAWDWELVGYGCMMFMASALAFAFAGRGEGPWAWGLAVYAALVPLAVDPSVSFMEVRS